MWHRLRDRRQRPGVSDQAGTRHDPMEIILAEDADGGKSRHGTRKASGLIRMNRQVTQVCLGWQACTGLRVATTNEVPGRHQLFRSNLCA
ncbi:MAG: hypothetical protein U1F83_04660 [Verrucomicrobiota bacterium]